MCKYFFMDDAAVGKGQIQTPFAHHSSLIRLSLFLSHTLLHRSKYNHFIGRVVVKKEKKKYIEYSKQFTFNSQSVFLVYHIDRLQYISSVNGLLRDCCCPHVLYIFVSFPNLWRLSELMMVKP